MKNEGVPIVREGLPFLLVSSVATTAFYVAHLWWAFIPTVLLTLFIAFFFRNPERLPPVGSAMVASPADGRIISIGQSLEPEFLQEEMLRISIFMSLLDVHVNRVPVDGTIRDMKYHRGRFMAAYEENAVEENERNALLIETSQGQRVVVVQVAGLLARRIVCYPAVGAFVLRGQRMGLIRFGSRTDIYLPLSTEILVKIGEKVLGGETILAQLKERTA